MSLTNKSPLIIFSLLLLLPIKSFAYVIPTFPVPQAFPISQHPTLTTIEEASITIDSNDNTVNVTTEMVLTSKNATAVSLMMNSHNIRQLEISVGNELLPVKDSPECNSSLNNNNNNIKNNCYKQTNIKIPAGKPVKVISKYQIRSHSGEVASSLYGDTLPKTLGPTQEESSLLSIKKEMQTYAISLKSLKRWHTPPKKLTVILKGQNLLSYLRDLSPSGWLIKGQELIWNWDSTVAPLPSLDIAWQEAHNISVLQETNIVNKLYANNKEDNNYINHIMTLKRFNGPRDQYIKALEKALALAEENSILDSPANDLRITFAPDLIATKLIQNGPQAAKSTAEKYFQIFDSLQESILLEGQDLTPSTDAINIINQLISQKAANNQ